MTGVVTRDSAQRRLIDKHRSDARDTYNTAERLSPIRPARLPVRARCSPSIARSPTPSTETATPSAARNGRFEARSVTDPLPNRDPQCPGFRKRASYVEPGRSGRRQRRGPAPRCLLHAETAVHHEAHQRAESLVPVRDVSITLAPSLGILDMAVRLRPEPGNSRPDWNSELAPSAGAGRKGETRCE